MSESNASKSSPMMGDLKSVEFSYEELAAATENFHVAHKIGQGGFASVYYGLIRGQVDSSTYLTKKGFLPIIFH
jgi:chitin elicitor receptor kinase 1